MRSVLNIAITEMVYREGSDNNRTDDTCPVNSLNAIPERQGFDWSEELQGVILGAFFWGYVS